MHMGSDSPANKHQKTPCLKNRVGRACSQNSASMAAHRTPALSPGLSSTAATSAAVAVSIASAPPLPPPLPPPPPVAEPRARASPIAPGPATVFKPGMCSERSR